LNFPKVSAFVPLYVIRGVLIKQDRLVLLAIFFTSHLCATPISKIQYLPGTNKLTFKYYICLLFLLLEGCAFAWLLESTGRTSWLAGCFLCLVGCGFAWCENFVGAVGTSAAVWLVHVTSVAVWLVHVLARLANKA
jgi:hypothetical protein